MSTVAEIESALEKLPLEAQHELAAWLGSKLRPETPAMLAAIDEAERSLADLVITPDIRTPAQLGLASREWVTQAGEQAAVSQLPQIRALFEQA